MFEPVIAAWLRYSTLLDEAVPPDDTRLSMSAEIHTRFGQLDLILARIVEIFDVSELAGSADEATHRRFLDTWDWVAIHTDSFYFFGWRIIDMLNGAAGNRFPYLEPIKPEGFLAVRSAIHDRPERQSEYYQHGIEFRHEALEKIGKAITAVLESKE